MNEWLECEVSAGMFTSEFAVAAKEHDGRTFSLFASEDDVHVDTQPNGSAVRGSLRVTSIQKKDDLVLIALPQPSLEAGLRVTVNRRQLHPA